MVILTAITVISYAPSTFYQRQQRSAFLLGEEEGGLKDNINPNDFACFLEIKIYG